MGACIGKLTFDQVQHFFPVQSTEAAAEGGQGDRANFETVDLVGERSQASFDVREFACLSPVMFIYRGTSS